MRAWAGLHRAALADALAHAARTPFASLLSIGALAVALALPLAGSVVVGALSRVAARFDADPQISVFLRREASAKDRQALEKAIRSRPGIKTLKVITKEQALADLQATEGVRDLLAGLPGNPLPDTLIVAPADSTRAAIDALRTELLQLPNVAAVQVDAAWVERLEAFVRTGRLIATGLALMLGVAVVAVSFNTIRLQVLTRARELDVAALFGATRAWLRRPFLYFGALQGLAAGGLSVALVGTFVAILNQGLRAGAAIAEIPDGFATLTLELVLTASLGSAVLGWVGAWLSVREHLTAHSSAPG